MSEKTEAIRDDLSQIGGDLKGLADALRNDPKVQQRKALGWGVLYGGGAAGTAIVARKLAARTWGVLTGETPPPVQPSHGPNGQAVSGTSRARARHVPDSRQSGAR